MLLIALVLQHLVIRLGFPTAVSFPRAFLTLFLLRILRAMCWRLDPLGSILSCWFLICNKLFVAVSWLLLCFSCAWSWAGNFFYLLFLLKSKIVCLIIYHESLKWIGIQVFCSYFVFWVISYILFAFGRPASCLLVLAWSLICKLSHLKLRFLGVCLLFLCFDWLGLLMLIHILHLMIFFYIVLLFAFFFTIILLLLLLHGLCLLLHH